MAYRCLAAAVLVLLSTAAFAQTAPIIPVKPAEVKKYLQVPSPDWRDQVIYMVMTDRFFDGNPANSDQKKGEFDPTTNAKFSGGDLAGLVQKLDYIKGLGATALWITPPVANQWWDPLLQYGGYHGYWAENFVEVDKHLGTLADYQLLSATLHKNGMALIQDIVANHTGNFFHIEGIADPDNPTKGITLNTGSVPVSKPSQKPFDQNDFTKKADRNANIYHWTGNILNGLSRTEMQNNQLSDLDDLNTENPVVMNALKDSYNFWIKNVGVDAFRIDTVKYVPHDFWNDFHWSTDKKHPGVEVFAKSLGKKDFFTFGEDWETNGPYLEKPDKTMADFLGTEDSPELSSVLNFSLNSDLRDVFAQGRPTDALTFRFASLAKNFPDPARLVNFIDNHDMDRFATSADKTSLQQALLFLFTIPGIPVVYYGTEQGFTETRASMFAAGYGSGGKDHFDTQSEGYRFVQSLTSLRAAEREFSRGKVQVVKDAGAAGIFAYTVTDGKRTALVAFNTSNSTMVLANGATGLPAGTKLVRLTGLNDTLAGDPAALAGVSRYDTLTVGSGGLVNAILAPRSAVVLAASAAVDPAVAKLAPALAPVGAATGPAAIAGPADPAVKLNLDPKKLPVFPGSLEVTGTLPPVTGAKLVIGGNLDAGTPITVAADGTWKAPLAADRFNNGVYDAVVQARNADGSLYLSAPYRFRVELAFTSKLTYDDPVGDDHGPTGDYRYPKNNTFTNQNDLKTVELRTAGTSLQVVITPAGPISTAWAPPNGFDHVAFYVYLQVPGVAGGATVLPMQNGNAPAGLAWNRMAFFGGWNAMLFGPDGATLKSYGNAVSPAGKVAVDKAKNQIILTFGGDSLGAPATLSGTKVYVTTWDYDGLESSNRKLTAEGADYIYGGPADGPLVMDDTPVLVVP
jgi:glycosidase